MCKQPESKGGESQPYNPDLSRSTYSATPISYSGKTSSYVNSSYQGRI